MTRRTLKGGAAGYLARGSKWFGSKALKTSQNKLIERNATSKMFSLSNPKTFMGQKLKVHAYGLQEVAAKVFDFARKYEKYSRVCRKDKEQCLVDFEKDKTAVLEEIKKLPTLDDLTIKDPRGSYAKTEAKKQLRKEDFLFLFRVNLLLKKWGEPSDFLVGYTPLFNADETNAKGGIPNLEEEFHRETKRLETNKFNERYEAQYEFVAQNAKNPETESAMTSEVQTYVEGIQKATETDGVFSFSGKKYNLTKKKRPDNKFEYTIAPV